MERFNYCQIKIFEEIKKTKAPKLVSFLVTPTKTLMEKINLKPAKAFSVALLLHNVTVFDCPSIAQSNSDIQGATLVNRV